MRNAFAGCSGYPDSFPRNKRAPTRKDRVGFPVQNLEASLYYGIGNNKAQVLGIKTTGCAKFGVLCFFFFFRVTLQNRSYHQCPGKVVVGFGPLLAAQEVDFDEARASA